MSAATAPVDLAIETMTREDIPTVVALASGATAAQLEEEITRPWALPVVARDRTSGQLVGFLLTWHVTDEVHVLDVVVAEPMRRRGIGTILMQHALAWARKRAAVHIYLEVRRGNEAAIHLYRGLGFFTLNVRKKYYPDGEDAIEMAARMDRETGVIASGKDEVDPTQD